MVESGEKTRETIRPKFNPSIMIDFQGAKITSDTGFLLLRELKERLGIFGPIGSELEDTQTVNGMAHQPFHQGRSESIVSLSEEASSCGLFVSVGPTLSGHVWVTSMAEKTVDGVTEGEVRSETE